MAYRKSTISRKHCTPSSFKSSQNTKPSKGPVNKPFKSIDKHLESVKKLLKKQMSDKDEIVGSFTKHLNICGGKFLRASLVLLSGKACGSVNQKHIRVAAIAEMIHYASLLHDDVIDDGKIRRGQLTMNILHGNEPAVLLGDLVLSKTFTLCSQLQTQVIDIIADCVSDTCRGELRQISQRSNWQLGQSEYVDIISKKTGSLFSMCCRIGAMLAGADKKTQKNFERFGFNLGIAFQISDDLLDILSDESAARKTTGRDIEKNTVTLALIHLLQSVDGKERKHIIKLLNSSHKNTAELIAKMKAIGSVDYTRKTIEEFIFEALRCIEALPDNQAKEALKETAVCVAQRVR